MCGLFGAISSHPFTTSELETITELGVVSSLRGIDSTGIATVQRAKKGRLEVKQKQAVSNPVSFLYDKATQTMMKDKFLVMGHARAATYGAVNLTNAHPITEGRFIGCHNGSVWSYAPPKADEHKLTDSRLLYREMNRVGLVEALQKTGSGAYALTFIDTDKRTMNFIRNDQRPLFMVESTGGTVCMWASEWRFLQLAMFGTAMTWKTPFLLNEYKLYQYELYSNSMTLRTLDLRKDIKDYGSVTILPPTRGPGVRTMYCRICTKAMAGCKCEAPRYISPFEYQISACGLYFTPDAKEDHKKPVTQLLSNTSVPGVYSSSALTPLIEYASCCQKEKQFCFCEVKKQKAAELTPARRDQLATGKRYNSFKHGEPHFIGYGRREYTPTEAKKKLNVGCCECNAVCSLGVKTYWVGEDFYFCDDCHKDPKVIETMKGTSTWLGKFMHPENYTGETKH